MNSPLALAPHHVSSVAVSDTAHFHDEIATVVHDLGSPTAAIISLAESLLAGLDGPLTEKQKYRIGRIQTAAGYLLQLGSNLLAAARLDQGRVQLDLARRDLTEVVRDAAELARPLARAKDIQIDVQPMSAIVTSDVDVLKLNRVMSNLLVNAIKFSSPGTSVDVSVRTEGECAVIAVSDHGPGIPAAETKRLFRKFSTTSVAATRGERGTGLGLYIAQRLVQLHGGSIRLRTEEGRGSTFEVVLPSRVMAHA